MSSEDEHEEELVAGITIMNDDGLLLSIDVTETLLSSLEKKLGRVPNAVDVEFFIRDALVAIESTIA